MTSVASGQDVVEKLGDVLVAGMNFGGHRFHDDVVDRLGNFWIAHARRGSQPLAAHQPIDVRGRGRSVWQHASQHLIHADAERIDVRREYGFAVKLLGCHIGRTADNRRAVRGDLKKPRRAEVGDLEESAVHHNHV